MLFVNYTGVTLRVKVISKLPLGTRNMIHHQQRLKLGIPYYYLGEGCKSLSNEIKVALIEIFDSIQLDVRVSDGYSGESKWLNVQLNEDFEFEYIFDEDD